MKAVQWDVRFETGLGVNKKIHEAGSISALSPEEAEKRIGQGLCHEVEPPTPEDRPEGDALVEAIADAISGLDPKEDYTTAGKPNATALSHSLGYMVSAAERDAGWKAYEARDGKQPSLPVA